MFVLGWSIFAINNITYNKTVICACELQLPASLPVEWNSRMTKTAGYCIYKREKTTLASNRSVRIELSTKVCDSAGVYMILSGHSFHKKILQWEVFKLGEPLLLRSGLNIFQLHVCHELICWP